MQEYLCECGRSFDAPQAFNGHKSHCRCHALATGKLDSILSAEQTRHENCSKAWLNKQEDIIRAKQARLEQKLAAWRASKPVCEVCGKVMTNKFGSGRFCSDACAHHRNLSEEAISIIKQKLSAYAKEHPTGFASPDFVQKGTRKNHSKRELEIVDYLKANFPDDSWKQGFIQGKTKYNGYYLNPDLHSNKLHVVIEYDGIWHFKDINGQLAHKQAVDRAMTNWCKENNYKLIRIDEELNITNAQIVDAIYNSSSQLILFNSKRYDYLNLN